VKFAVVALILTFVGTASAAQKLAVRVVDRRDSDTDYSYVVPGHFTAQSNANVNCYGSNCNGSETTNGSLTAAHEVPYHVRGATFSLQLPDGRIAVVNCESKFAERMRGPEGNHRSCRMPLVDEFEADFHGDKAKLEWVVSLDGKKKESETYRVLAVLPKPREVAASN
jgi:hypothetical protein